MPMIQLRAVNSDTVKSGSVEVGPAQQSLHKGETPNISATSKVLRSSFIPSEHYLSANKLYNMRSEPSSKLNGKL